MKANIFLLGLVGMLSLASGQGRMPDYELRRTQHAAHEAVMDSLREVEPWFRRSWLAERGLEDYYQAQSFRPDSQGLRVVGRWSYGPSVKVSLRATEDDTIVCLARGSGASIIRFRSEGGLRLDLLSDIDCYGLVSRAIIRDTLVFIGMGSGGTGIEVWGVSDLTAPQRLSYVHLPPIMDIAVQDTFLYATGYVRDSLRIFSVADPRNPVQVGACADSGFPMHVSGDYCYLADRGGVNIIDVSDPTRPRRVGKAGSGGIALSVTVRDTLCFFGLDNNTLQVYNVRNPANPSYLGSVSGTLPADLYLPPTCDTVLYTPRLDVVNIADPRNPRIIGHASCPGWDYGVTAVPALNYALVADHYKGLVAVNIADPTQPRLDTLLFAADMAMDISINDGRAYVANYFSGLQILDVTDPAAPRFLGQYDTTGTRPRTSAAVTHDSFAYVGWSRPRFVSVDVSDPTRPRRVGGAPVTNRPEAMVLRDSLVYVAMHGGLQVVNVARPREPEMVGSCGWSGATYGMCLQDTLAFVSCYPLAIVNIADPVNPSVIGAIYRGSWSVSVRDTLAFLAHGGVVVYNVANPASPRVVDSIIFYANTFDVLVEDTLAFVASRDGVRLLDVRDPHNMRVLGFTSLPADGWRLRYVPPYIYVVCRDAGVSIIEMVETGVVESDRGKPHGAYDIVVRPNPARNAVTFRFPDVKGGLTDIKVYTVTGQGVSGHAAARGCEAKLDIGGWPAGIYYVVAESRSGQSFVAKFVKQ